MEKRLFLAVALSFFVIYLWAFLTPKPKNTANIPLDVSEIVDNKQFTKKQDLRSESVLTTSPSATENIQESFDEEFTTLKNEIFTIVFSNKGGVIKEIFLNKYGETLPVNSFLLVSDFKDAAFVIEEQSEKEIVYKYSNNGMDVLKKYVLSDEEYLINGEVTITNNDLMSKIADFSIVGTEIDMSNLRKDNEKDKALYEYSIFQNNKTERKDNAYKFSDKERKYKENIEWFSFRNRYFCTIIKPLYKNFGLSVNPLGSERLSASFDSKAVSIASKEEIKFSYLIYYGPQNINILKSKDPSFINVMAYSGFALFDGIAKIIHSLIVLLHKIFPNWGVSIILGSAIVYLSTYPLTLRGMASMKKMQSLQPKIAELRKKYENNPQKLNKETMELYKENRINPLGGCLPFLLQMPIFIGLYQVLWRSIEFKGATFLWIDDLSQPDRLIILKQSLPFIGNEINILPLIMVVIMFFQQKLSAKNMILTDPAQIAQQKMMATIFPALLGVLFYKFASGMNLYFTMFYMFSTLTQYKMTKETKVA